jgi:hypothetical protein
MGPGPGSCGFYGDIKGLDQFQDPPETAFWLAYGTRFLYPVGLPCERTAPAVILAGLAMAFSSEVETVSREENAPEIDESMIRKGSYRFFGKGHVETTRDLQGKP